MDMQDYVKSTLRENPDQITLQFQVIVNPPLPALSAY